jgi:ATP-dependent RNA helicase SUPV3L1/SUV3
VAVLDEVQMLGDATRGWSWTRVLLGLPAAQLHLCGDAAAAGLLHRLAASCGDALVVERYRCARAVCAGLARVFREGLLCPGLTD